MVIITRTNPTAAATPAMNCTFTRPLFLPSGKRLVKLEEGDEGGVLTTCPGDDFDVVSFLGGIGGRGGDLLTDDGVGEDLEEEGGGLSEGGAGDAVGGEDSAVVTEWNGVGAEALVVEEFDVWAVAEVDEETILQKWTPLPPQLLPKV